MPRNIILLSEGHVFIESPRWHNGRLWFSDFFDKAVKSLSLSGELRTELLIDDQPSGLGWRPDGALLVVSMIRRALLLSRTSGETELWADLALTAAFHCNDMVVDGKGGAYVGNYGFDLSSELAIRGRDSVLADHPTATLTYVSPEGIPRIVADQMHFPNGSVILPDQKTLVVAETLDATLTAFDIAQDGSLSNRRAWARIPNHVPDGIALDREGCIWVADPITSECVRVQQGGTILDRIPTEQPCIACELGGPDNQVLFLLTCDVFDHRHPPAVRTGRVWAVYL